MICSDQVEGRLRALRYLTCANIAIHGFPGANLAAQGHPKGKASGRTLPAALSLRARRANPAPHFIGRRAGIRFKELPTDGPRAACRMLPQAPLHRVIVLSAAPTLAAGPGVPGLEKRPRVFVAPVVAAVNGDIIRRQARHEAALRLVVQHRDELGAIVGLAAQRLVRDDDRGSRHCGRRNTIEYILRDGDAVERVLGVVPAVDRDHGPAQACVAARHRRENMRADRFFGITDRDRSLDRRIEYLASAVRRRLMGVAPHVKLLRRAADVDRDRLQRELRIIRRLGGVGLPGRGRLGRVLCGNGVGLRLRVGFGGVELGPQFCRLGGGFLLEVLGPRPGLVRFGGGEHLVGERKLGASAPLEEL